MECMLQWLDDLDDLAATLAYLVERLLPALYGVLLLGATLVVTLAGAVLAFHQPPLALALVCLLTVAGLYRGSVNRPASTVNG